MGSAEPRSFSRGKRGIAGSLVFTIFDRDALLDALREHIKQERTFHRIGGNDLTSAHPMTIDQWDKQMTNMAVSGISGATANAATQITEKVAKVADPDYDDEVPPFDITISFANEYGQKAKLVIFAVEILNEGSGFSIDNVTSEKACTFVARRVQYMQPVNSTNIYTNSSASSALQAGATGLSAAASDMANGESRYHNTSGATRRLISDID